MENGKIEVKLPPVLEALAAEEKSRFKRNALIGAGIPMVIGGSFAYYIISYVTRGGRGLSDIRGEELFPILGGLLVAAIAAAVIVFAFVRKGPFQPLREVGVTLSKYLFEDVVGNGTGYNVLVLTLNNGQVIRYMLKKPQPNTSETRTEMCQKIHVELRRSYPQAT